MRRIAAPIVLLSLLVLTAANCNPEIKQAIRLASRSKSAAAEAKAALGRGSWLEASRYEQEAQDLAKQSEKLAGQANSSEAQNAARQASEQANSLSQVMQSGQVAFEAASAARRQVEVEPLAREVTDDELEVEIVKDVIKGVVCDCLVVEIQKQRPANFDELVQFISEESSKAFLGKSATVKLRDKFRAVASVVDDVRGKRDSQQADEEDFKTYYCDFLP